MNSLEIAITVSVLLLPTSWHLLRKVVFERYNPEDQKSKLWLEVLIVLMTIVVWKIQVFFLKSSF